MLAPVTPSVDPSALRRPLRPIPFRSVRPWAGGRLGAPGEDIGELWLAGPGSIVDVAGAGEAGAGGTGSASPMTLDELAAAVGPALVGERGMRLLGPRFPLLVKVIDAAEWLSLQVHPDDALAAELYGEGQLGKAEAWLVLDAEPGATLVTGPRLGLAEADLRAAIRDGVVDREHCDERPCLPGDALMLRAGTMHAIGPGTFVYEIEQPTDRTFRMSDWGRPATAERPLHVAESLRAIRPERHALPAGRDWRLDGGALTVPEFRLEIAEGRGDRGGARARPRAPRPASRARLPARASRSSPRSAAGWPSPATAGTRPWSRTRPSSSRRPSPGTGSRAMPAASPPSAPYRRVRRGSAPDKRPVADGRHVQPEVMREREPDRPPHDRVRDAPLRRPHQPRQRDRPQLLAQHQAVPRLAGDPRRDRDLARIARLGPRGGDRAHGGEAGPVERLVADDERATRAALLVSLDRVQPEPHDRPPERPRRRHSRGHVSASADA